MKIRKPSYYTESGPAISEPDYRPRDVADPEGYLQEIFQKLRRDYGGPLRGFKAPRGLSPEAREANRLRSKAWYAANKEKAMARAAKWKQDNPDRHRQIDREATARYRAKRKVAAGRRERELERAPV